MPHVQKLQSVRLLHIYIFSCPVQVKWAKGSKDFLNRQFKKGTNNYEKYHSNRLICDTMNLRTKFKALFVLSKDIRISSFHTAHREYFMLYLHINARETRIISQCLLAKAVGRGISLKCEPKSENLCWGVYGEDSMTIFQQKLIFNVLK